MSLASRALVAVAAAALALVVIGAPLLLMMTPPYTRVLVVRVDAPALADLGTDDALARAEEVRAFVAGAPEATLPEALSDGTPAFDEKAVSHLADVRDVIHAARLVTLIALVIAGAFAVWALAGGRRRELGAALSAAAWSVVGLVALAGIVALADFDLFFSAFHAVFFEAGTWQFASDALLIRLFPEPFWAASGAAWALLSLTGALALWLLGRGLRERPPRASA